MKEILSKNIRTCVVTRQKKQQNELLRITKNNDVWQINTTNAQGRSFYIQKDKAIIEKFLNFKNYNAIRYFKMTEELEKELEKYAQNL